MGLTKKVLKVILILIEADEKEFGATT